ncbi:exodeoxyribonuclease VII large subunit [Nitrosococcus watsonii]|uniref:Exodeoxyribonuclease 7 large subunit n=1 Tax=Nitrosococcus watsoni (strain C-113) TaxID=105559 RepID=D8K9D6_NITWC|nr:exodeoxyribonuclease VII large subunit [Nitrosococcus watsonii]ADJ29279.1 exodeoxyribonuclease VII, large subunit [Nitrosococcus watsonii C-113]
MENTSYNLNPAREIYTISRLVREARHLLEGSFPLLWIEGEVSNLSRPSSGHFYFTLKDKTTQVRCAMFRGRNRLLGITLEEGMQILARVQVGLYEARGEFQLIVEYLEKAGDGALRRAFEALKQRLSSEGLFATSHKRSLPILPRQIGIITSPSGAAIRDILSVLKRRFPTVPVLIYPVPVQGEGAAQKIATAIAKAEQQHTCDLLILARGGGSLEDLWAFNEEALARAIYHCPIPIISGVGHEIDFTIADFAADQRAPTPSAAAEMAVPDSREWYRNVLNLEQRLGSLFQQRLRYLRQSLESLTQRLRHPQARLQEGAQRIDELEQRLDRAWTHLKRERLHQLGGLSLQLQRLNPAQYLKACHLRLGELNQLLHTYQQQHLEKQRMQLEMAQRSLQAINPQTTLERGYAIVTGPKGIVLRKASQVQPGARIEVQLAEGHIRGEVTETLDKP